MAVGESITRFVGEIVMEILIFVAQKIFVAIGKGTIYFATLGRVKIDESQMLHVVSAGVLGFVLLGSILSWTVIVF